jgi:hypothetical protein
MALRVLAAKEPNSAGRFCRKQYDLAWKDGQNSGICLTCSSKPVIKS